MTGRRIQIINPYLSLGSAVHETIEGLSEFPEKERMDISLKERFEQVFEKYKGVNGGFISRKKEEEFKQRGVMMVERVERSSFLGRPSASIKTNFPVVNLIGEEVKLVGSLDWVEVLPDGKAHIVDFKTGNHKENNGSLQLPIYSLLARENLDREVKKVSYWYLQHDDHPVEQEIDDPSNYLNTLKERSLSIKGAIEKNHFPCSYPGRCFACGDYEKIFQGDAELISSNNGYNKDIFCIFKERDVIEKVLEEDFLDEREKKMFELRMRNSMDIVERELNLSKEKSEKIARNVKKKLKDNLRPKELKVIVRSLKE